MTPVESTEDAIQWLADQVYDCVAKRGNNEATESSLHILRADFALILIEWRQRFPGYEVAPGVTIVDMDARFGPNDTLTVAVELGMVKPRWKTQFQDLVPVAQYQNHDLYTHLGFTLAFYGDRKYLVCSELSAHQTAQEMFIVAQRHIHSTDDLMSPLLTPILGDGV